MTRSPARHTRRVSVACAVLTVLLTGAGVSAPSAVAEANTQFCPPAASTPLITPPSESSPAPAPPAPTQVVACIGAQPILGATLSHWTAVAQKDAGTRTDAATLQTMSFLISGDWMLDEASGLGVHVSEAVVRRSFDRIRAQQFPRRREFKAFLRSSGETVGDLLFRVRLTLTSQRIERHFFLALRGKKDKAKTFARFVASFKRKWMAQTYCASTYAVADCARVF